MNNRFERFTSEASPSFVKDCSELLIDVLEHRKGVRDNTLAIGNQVRKILNLPLTLNCGRVPGNAILSGILLLLKTSPIYDEFNNEEKEKMSFIMEVLMYGNALLTRPGNGYLTGLDLGGDFCKGWGPNFRFSIYPQVIYGITYFGGQDRAAEMFLNFSFDNMLDRMRALGFTRAYEFYNSRYDVLKRIFEEGGELVVTRGENDYWMGTGCGIKVPYKYDATYRSLELTPKVLVKFNHDKAVNSKVDVDEDGTFDAYITDGTESPWEGQDGMFREFNSGSNGILKRSSLHYCIMDFALESALIETCKFVGIWDIDSESEKDVKELVLVGVHDLLYKAEHGYHSLTGVRREHKFGSDAFNFNGWKNYWNTYRLEVTE